MQSERKLSLLASPANCAGAEGGGITREEAANGGGRGLTGAGRIAASCWQEVLLHAIHLLHVKCTTQLNPNWLQGF